MERWNGRVALVTGANSGIGAAIAEALVKAGMKVAGADINVDAMQKFSTAVHAGSLTPVKCDLTLEKDIEDLFQLIKKKFGGVDVCFNNAGVLHGIPLLGGTPSEWKEMMAVNVIALCHCSKLATASMVERGVTDGQIIKTCSIGGQITVSPPEFSFYSATKHAVKFLTEGLRQEMIERKYKIRVASISPGMVRTNVLSRSNQKTKDSVSQLPHLSATDISNAALYILSCPPEVEVNEIIIRAQGHAL